MNKRRARWLGFVIPLLFMLIALPVIAATSSPLVVVTGLSIAVTNITSAEGVCPQPYTNTFYANGRMWVFYLNDDSDFVYKTAEPGGTLSSETTIVASTGLYAVEFCVWYDKPTNTVHYARHDMDPTPDEVVYRMGTPSSGGSITWAAAEQTVNSTPADLLTWRTVMAVDELHNPWVAWIDTNGTGTKGVVYVEASTTHNGTWTQNTAVSSNWSVDGGVANQTHAWFVNLCPIGGAGDNLMHLGWTSENQTAVNATGLYGVTFNASGNTSDIQNIAVDGMIYYLRPDAFDFYDIGSAVYVVYTDNAGAIVFGVKSQIQEWSEASFNFSKEEPGQVWIPTLSGYKSIVGGEDLLCIANNGTALYAGLHEYGAALSSWDWTAVWSVPAVGDFISRHNAAYKYSSPVTFAWENTDVSDTPDTDDVYLWWMDNSNDGLGYSPDTPTQAGANMLKVLLPLAAAIGITIAALALIGTSNPKAWLYAIVIGLIAFIIIKILVDTLL